jgi:hypothetical protein
MDLGTMSMTHDLADIPHAAERPPSLGYQVELLQQRVDWLEAELARITEIVEDGRYGR